MKAARQHTRDRHEDRSEREEKLGQASDTLPGKTLRDRTPAQRDIPRSKAARVDLEVLFASGKAEPGPYLKPAQPSAEFSVFAPNAKSVHIAGTFNDWNPSSTRLIKQTDGSWRIAIDIKPGAYEYRFVVDGKWQEDPMACDSVANPYGSRNSIKHVA